MGKTKVVLEIDRDTYLRLNHKRCIEVININKFLKCDEPDLYLQLITLGVPYNHNIKISFNHTKNRSEYFIRWRTRVKQEL